MTFPVKSGESDSFFLRYRAPLVSTLLLLSGLLLWLQFDNRSFQEWELAKGRNYVSGFQQALVVYLGQLDGMDAAELSAAFDLLVASSHPLKSVVLLKEGRPVATSKPALEGYRLDGPQGILTREDGYLIWCPFQGRLARGGSGMSSEEFTLVLLVDPRPPDKSLIGRREQVALTFGLAAFCVLVTMSAWGLTIRNRDLSGRLLREQMERRHLDRLGLAAAGLAHETKNPLGIILGHAQRLARAPGVSDQAREAAFQIQDAAESASTRLGEFIEYARLREIERVPVEATSLIERVRGALAMDFEEEGVKLRSQIAPVILECDREMTAQVLVNLLLNSLHASRSGSEVMVSLERRGDSAWLSVADRGCGIPQDLLPEVFDPYVSGRAGGHGLGLALVKRVADRHAWSLELESSEGEGTTVTIGGISLSESEAS